MNAALVEVVHELRAESLRCMTTGDREGMDDFEMAEFIERRLEQRHLPLRAMQALESLTPSGSEFVGDVDRCVAFVKHYRASMLNVIKQARGVGVEISDRWAREAAQQIADKYELLGDHPGAFAKCKCGRQFYLHAEGQWPGPEPLHAFEDENDERARQIAAHKNEVLNGIKAIILAYGPIGLDFVKSPCGHSSQYAYSEDGGKHIVCLLCIKKLAGDEAIE